jgi:hypothetical protein
MTENEIAKHIVDAALKVHRRFGPGLLESVYDRADLIVEDKVIVEIKSVEAIAPVHHKQVLTYLKVADKRLGFPINFNVELIKDGIKRVVNGLQGEGNEV